MGIISRIALKNIFKTGNKPAQKDFGDMVDSLMHKEDAIAISKVSGLSEKLENSMTAEDKKTILTALETQETAWSELKDQTVLKYNDAAETVASDILKFADKTTGENVNYRKTTVWADGTPMDDSKVDGVIFQKTQNGGYLKMSYDADISASLSGAHGDGNSDDTHVLQKFFDAVDEGSTVKIPPKRFLLTKPLKINKKLKIVGAGKKSLFICVDNGGVVLNAAGTTLQDFAVSRYPYFFIDSNDKVGITVGNKAERMGEIRFLNVFVEGFQTAVKCWNLWNSEFSALKTFRTQLGIDFHGQNVNNEISGNTSMNFDTGNGATPWTPNAVGIKFSGTAGFNDIDVSEGLRITNTLIYGATTGIIAEKMSHVTFQNSMIDFCREKGILLLDRCFNWNCTGNYIAMSGTAGSTVVHLANNDLTYSPMWARGHKFCDNDILVYSGATCDYAFYVEGAGSLNDLISGNSIKGFSQSDIVAKPNLRTIITQNVCLSDVVNNIVGNYITENNIGKVYYQLLTDRITIGSREMSYGNSRPAPDALSNAAIVFNSEPGIGKPAGWMRSDKDGGYYEFGTLKPALATKGATAERPTYGLTVGYQFFDTTINKPVWAKNTDNPTAIVWVDSAGAAV